MGPCGESQRGNDTLANHQRGELIEERKKMCETFQEIIGQLGWGKESMDWIVG